MPFISENELIRYGEISSLSGKAVALVNQQRATWKLASDNYRSLEKVQTRSFQSGPSRVVCQFNPGRIRSSAANTSATAILSRPCFLCGINRPGEQYGIPFSDQLVILTNPYPIFPYHLTIPSNNHVPQQISGNTETLADLSKALDGFILLYNGPQCGASAPDHFHFQAGIKGILPIEEDLEQLTEDHDNYLVKNKYVKIRAVQNIFRRFILFKSSDKEMLVRSIDNAINILRDGAADEPMINILSRYTSGAWQVVLFPRALQRPCQYFADGDEKLLVSPAAVELGGLIVLPREEDFRKITSGDLVSILDQVSIGQEDFESLKRNITASA